MTAAKSFARLMGLIAVSLAAGCAPAYHSYSSCYVDCQYCPPPPLPYVHYEECACHSCAASQHLWAPPTPSVEGAAEP